MTKPRWLATVIYRTEGDIAGIGIEHDLAEIGELDALVENGPHWDTIEKIEIVRVNHVDSAKLTVEQAREL